MPQTKKNQFSTKQFDKIGGDIHIESKICTLTNQQKEVIAMCKLISDLYRLGLTTKASASVIASPTITHDNKVDLWHRRLGHISQRKLHKLHQMQFMSTNIETFDDK